MTINCNFVMMVMNIFPGSANRPCRFFKSAKGCFRGDECPYLHLEDGED